jgi:hypothetical protein
MLEFFEWLFDDFWRFLQFVIIVIIMVQWKPLEVNVLNGHWKEHDNENQT